MHLYSLKKIHLLLLVLALSVLGFVSCTKEYSYEGGATPFAQGTLKDSSGNCLHDSAVGSFYIGVAPDPDTNFIEVEINVTQAGTYNISTDIQNGLRFADSGNIYQTGDTVIRLKPIGIPVDTGSIFYTVSFNNDACYFFVDVQDSVEKRPGDWQFTEGGFIYNGNFQSALGGSLTDSTTEVVLDGSTFSGDTSISIDFVIDTTDIVPGTYTTINNGALFIMIDGITPSILYTADPSTPGTNIIINITAYDSATGLMEGIFSGNVLDKSGNIVPIINGSFAVIVH